MIKLKFNNNIIKEFEKQAISPDEAVDELVTNSIAAESDSIELNVAGKWTASQNGSLEEKNSYFIIKDDGCGIEVKDLDEVLSPTTKANSNSKTLNRHGLWA